MISFTVFFLLLTNNCALGYYEELFSEYKSRSSWTIQSKAVEGVINRLLGSSKAQLFKIKINENISVNGMDTFNILKSDSDFEVTVTGSNAISVTWGFHYYLKNYCNCHISWDGDQLNLPDILPSVNITKSSYDQFRYYQNACTQSYSYVWWEWPRWEREIDWMALNGINVALAFTAQEAIWQRVYDGLGLSESGFTGPGFLAWNRMGNLRSFGGGLSFNWHKKSIDLQHLIINRMNELGIIAILPAFSGIVPKSFKKKFPSSNVVNITKWNNFSDEYCCPYLLSPTDPMFPIISRVFLREYILEFGTNHIYNCDTFNENIPPSSDSQYLSDISKAVYEGIIQIDPLAVWVVQGWMFSHPFWGKREVEAYVTGVPMGKMLILDLQADLTPQYENFDSFYGQPFIWCTLHNFGGQLGIYGNLNLVNEGVVNGRNFPNSTMVGIGIAPEGIDQNYVMYDFTLDSALRSTPVNLTQWIFSYADRRYNIKSEQLRQAWFILMKTAYDYNPESYKYMDLAVHISKNILIKRPSLTMGEMVWYRRSEMLEVFQYFVEASRHFNGSSSELFVHDFIDVTRQVIQLGVGCLYRQLMAAYITNNSILLQKNGELLLELIDSLDVVLSSGKKFLLGSWLSDAKKIATSVNESLQYEYNARNQITLWGPRGEIRDYAAKQWAGLIADYYRPRWNIFISALNESLNKNIKYNAAAVRMKMFSEVERPFTLSKKDYPTDPKGNPISLIYGIDSKWSRILKNLFDDSDV